MTTPVVTPSALVLRTGIEGFRFTQHAIDRMTEMAVSWRSVLNAIKAPQVDYPSLRYKGCRLACRDLIAVAYDPKDNTIITILWNTPLPWTRGNNPFS